jgi:hypothetical protein
LEVRITIANTLLIAVAEVATCDHQVGNGIRFISMLQEDMEQLRLFLDEYEKNNTVAVEVFVDDQHELSPKSEFRPCPGWVGGV